jgi:hypothetical protein
MGTPVTQPTDLNFLSPLGFKFTIKKLPNFDYFVQSFDFPSLSLNRTKDMQTPFNKVIITGDHLTFGDFSVTFKIDENMAGYFELYNWIVGIGKPDNFNQYAALANNAPTSGKGVIVDADLIILDSVMRPNIKVTFSDVIPTSLSGFTFDTKNEDVRYVTATAGFKYREYTYIQLPAGST